MTIFSKMKCLGTLLAAVLIQHAVRAQMCGRCMIEYKVASMELGKVGFYNFVPDPTNPPPTKVYKQMVYTVTSEDHGARDPYDTWNEIVYKYILSRANPDDPSVEDACSPSHQGVTNSCTGTFDYEYISTCPTNEPCSGFYGPSRGGHADLDTGTCEWPATNGAYDGASPPDGHDLDQVCVNTDSYSVSSTSLNFECNATNFGGPGSSLHSITAQSISPTTATYNLSGELVEEYGYRHGFHNTSTNLSDEYTDEELFSRWKSHARNHYGGDWNSMDGNAKAIYTLAGDAACGSGQMLKYRFKIPQSQKEAEYKITWLEVAHYPDGKSQSRKKSESVKGTGDDATGTEHEAKIPEGAVTNGQTVTVTLDNVNIKITPPNDDGPGTVPGGGDGGNSSNPGSSSFDTTSFSACSSCGSRGGNFVGSDGSGDDVGPSIDLRGGMSGMGASGGRISLSTYPGQTIDPEDLEVTSGEASVSVGSPVNGTFGLAHTSITNITTGQGTVRITTTTNISHWKYQIDFSALNGDPICTWYAESSRSNLVVEKVVGGITVDSYHYTFTPAGSTLVSGNGMRGDCLTTTWDTNNFTRTELSVVTNSFGAIVYQTSRTYQGFSWNGTNEALVSETIGSGANALTTTYTYYDGGAAGYFNGSVRPLKSVVHPDKSWEYYPPNWGGSIPWVKYSAGDAELPSDGSEPSDSICRKVAYDYATFFYPDDDGSVEPYTPRTVTESLYGHVVSKKFVVVEGFTGGKEVTEYVCTDTSVSAPDAGDPTQLVTSTITGSDGWVYRIVHPDGTLSIYTHGSTGTIFETIERTGKPNVGNTDVIDGVKTIRTLNGASQLMTNLVIDIASGYTNVWDVYSSPDDLLRYSTVTHLDGTTETRTFDCCSVDTSKDRDGVESDYKYDALHRLTATSRLGITVTNSLDVMGNTLMTWRIGTDWSSNRLHGAKFDLANRLVKETNALNGVTTYDDTTSSGRRVMTKTFPDGGTSIETYYLDGTLRDLTGTAVFPMAYETGVETVDSVYRSFTLATKLDGSGDPTDEWTKTYKDAVGNDFKTLYPDDSYTQRYYNEQGRLWKEVNQDGMVTLYDYNGKGELEKTALDLDLSDTIDDIGTDRITKTVMVCTNDGTHGYVRSVQTTVWTNDSSNSPLLVSETQISLDGLKSWTMAFGQTMASGTTVNATLHTRVTMTTNADLSTIITAYTNGRLDSVTRNAGGTQIGAVAYGYDTHGRNYLMTDARNGDTVSGFNAADQVTGVTNAAPNLGVTAPVTLHTYDTMGRETGTTLSDGGTVTQEFYETGLLKKVHGARTYPVEYGYDAQGRMTSLTTWRNYAGSGGAAVTTWAYDLQRGWLTQKRDANEEGTDYSYYPSGLLHTRTWSRGVTTTYTYDASGNVTAASYSDSTPGVTLTYNRRGQKTGVSRDGVTTSLDYNVAGLLTAESYTGGPLGGMTLKEGYDGYYRRTNVLGLHSTTTLLQQNYQYDGASRLAGVNDGTNAAGYSYLANSGLVGEIDFTNAGTLRMSTVKQYDLLNRLTNTVSASNSTVLASYAYQYNSAHQRTRIDVGGNSAGTNTHWNYTYDTLGQVTGGKRYWSDNSVVAGQQFTYSFDDIGNRKTSGSGGDQYGANLCYASYTVNDVNEYTGHTVPGAIDVLGDAESTATVTVNTQPVYRKGEYFWKGLKVTNTSAAVWQTVTSLAAKPNGTNGTLYTNDIRSVFVAKTPETLSYDSDGNLASDGRWDYVWDGENRLVSMTSLSSNPSGSRRRLEFQYDYMGRRIEKKVSTWSGSAYVPTYTNRFLYDGWNVTAILAPNSAVLISFLWGNDLSGAVQEAGGVGGLLVVNEATNGQHFVCYDGNGNVSALIKTIDGSVSGRYEYGPFGEDVRVTGEAAKENLFRFSTKFTDEESGLINYGYRYYSPITGKWLSRDPSEEEEGIDLYHFNFNNPVGRIDTDGRGSITSPAAQQVLYQQLLEQIALDMKMTVQQVIKRISLCASIHAAYKALNCKGCGWGCFTKSEASTRAACLASEVGLRATYLRLKCDYFLPGSVGRGSAIAAAGHATELANKTAALVTCTAKAAP